MSKWLKIKEGSFINLDSINMWEYEYNKIEIRYANGSFLSIGMYGNVQVEKNDFGRIIKELKEYMSL
jgi:hypothetical protein